MMFDSTSPLENAIELLLEGTDRKRLTSGTSEAIKALRKADEISDKYDLPRPWPHLIAYRLAHVLFRSAKTLEDLQEVTQLLTIASESDCLGPLPRLYRIAALSRQGKEIEEMGPIFNRLLQQIETYSEDEERTDLFERTTALQNCFFNMLELAAYFTAYPYHDLEGKGLLNFGPGTSSVQLSQPFSDLYSKLGGWRVVGTIPSLTSKVFPGEMAIEEIEARMERGEIKPPCVAFKMSADRSLHHWNFNLEQKNGEFIWKKVVSHSNHLRFIASILQYNTVRNRKNLLVQIFNDDSNDSDDIFRQWKHRCTKALLDNLNSPERHRGENNITKIFLDDSSTEFGAPEFMHNIGVLGAVDTLVFAR